MGKVDLCNFCRSRDPFLHVCQTLHNLSKNIFKWLVRKYFKSPFFLLRKILFITQPWWAVFKIGFAWLSLLKKLINHFSKVKSNPANRLNLSIHPSTIVFLPLSFLLHARVKFWTFFYFNWDSPHARLNRHYEAWSYKNRSTKRITGYRKSV